jgi:hypothetical protein
MWKSTTEVAGVFDAYLTLLSIATFLFDIMVLSDGTSILIAVEVDLSIRAIDSQGYHDGVAVLQKLFTLESSRFRPARTCLDIHLSGRLKAREPSGSMGLLLSRPTSTDTSPPL